MTINFAVYKLLRYSSLLQTLFLLQIYFEPYWKPYFLSKTFLPRFSTTTSSITSALENIGLLIDGGPKKKKIKETDAELEPPTVNSIIPSQLNSQLDLQVKKDTINPNNDKNWFVCWLPSSICYVSSPIVKEDFNWNNIEIFASNEVERITFSKLRFMYVYTYYFTLKLSQEIDPIILKYFHWYQIFLP